MRSPVVNVTLPEGDVSYAALTVAVIAERTYTAASGARSSVHAVAAVTRAGSAYCALRLRAHDDDASVVGSPDLVPGLLDLLRTTFSDIPADTPTDTPHDDPQKDETP